MEWTLSEKIVTTELHSYDKDMADIDRFHTYGPPYRLSFPAKYYGYSTNIDGGPQYYVLLNFDGASLRPAVDVIRERYGVSTLREVLIIAMGGGVVPNYQPRIYDDLMKVTIKKRDVFSGNLRKKYQNPDIAISLTREMKGQISATESKSVGRYCGFDIFSSGTIDDVKKSLVNFDAVDVNDKSRVESASCYQKNNQCQVLISHRGFGFNIVVHPKNFCAFKESYEKLPDFIDRHASRPYPEALALKGFGTYLHSVDNRDHPKNWSTQWPLPNSPLHPAAKHRSEKP